MRVIIKISFAILLAAMVGCNNLNPFASDDKVVAYVGNAELYESDMNGVCAGVSGDDSVALAETYVDVWIKKQLKIQAAEVLFSESGQDIERMVDEYRNTLLNNKIDQYYVENYLDTMFTESHIQEYYNSRIDDFLLDREIVRGRIVKLPDSYRQRGKLKELMGSEDSERQQDFADLCSKNNFTIQEFGTWTDFSEFVSHLPVSKSGNFDEILNRRGVQEISTREDKYFYQITSIKRKGDLIPLERVRESIRRILYNQRKAELLKIYEDSLYNNAQREGTVKIYNNKKHK